MKIWDINGDNRDDCNNNGANGLDNDWDQDFRGK